MSRAPEWAETAGAGSVELVARSEIERDPMPAAAGDGPPPERLLGGAEMDPRLIIHSHRLPARRIWLSGSLQIT
jgi:hypothetical protein